MKIGCIQNYNTNVNFQRNDNKKSYNPLPYLLLSAASLGVVGCSSDKVELSAYKPIEVVSNQTGLSRRSFEKVLSDKFKDVEITEDEQSLMINAKTIVFGESTALSRFHLKIDKSGLGNGEISGSVGLSKMNCGCDGSQDSTEVSETDYVVEMQDFSAKKVKSPFDKNKEAVKIDIKSDNGTKQVYYVSNEDGEIKVTDSNNNEVDFDNLNTRVAVSIGIIFGLSLVGLLVSGVDLARIKNQSTSKPK